LKKLFSFFNEQFLFLNRNTFFLNKVFFFLKRKLIQLKPHQHCLLNIPNILNYFKALPVENR